MAGIEAAREFDQIAPVYDETRDPLDAETLTGLRNSLVEGADGALLEIGVGTGRVSRPLVELGIAVTGVDASRRMLEQARSKGIERLVRGNAYTLPFRDRAFDTAYFVHVLHVLDDPLRGLKEAARVSRRRVLALVESRERTSSPSAETVREGADPREVLRRAFQEAGLPPPPLRRPAEREHSLLARFPADSLTPVSTRVTDEPFSRRLDRMERRATRDTLRVPPERLHEILERVRAEVGDHRVTRRVTASIAVWEPARVLRTATLPPAPAEAA